MLAYLNERDLFYWIASKGGRYLYLMNSRCCTNLLGSAIGLKNLIALSSLCSENDPSLQTVAHNLTVIRNLLT